MPIISSWLAIGPRPTPPRSERSASSHLSFYRPAAGCGTTGALETWHAGRGSTIDRGQRPQSYRLTPQFAPV